MKKQLIVTAVLLSGQLMVGQATETEIMSSLLRTYNALFSLEAVKAAPKESEIDNWNNVVKKVEEFVSYNGSNVTYGRDALLDSSVDTIKKVNKDLIEKAKEIHKASADKRELTAQLSAIEEKMKSVVSELTSTIYYKPAKNSAKKVLLDLAERIKNAAGRLRREV